MLEISFIEQVMLAMIIVGLVIMTAIKTPMRAMFATMALGAMLTVVILYQTMESSAMTGVALLPVGMMIWPVACIIFFASYVVAAFIRKLLRKIKPSGTLA